MYKFTIVVIASIVLTGCGPGVYIDQATAKYYAVEHQVSLGDSKEKALAILLPTQESVPRNSRKKPDRYIKDGTKV
mgnify:CR=1 FL=1